MTTSHLPYDPQQQMLLPHALQDWLPEEHLAYYISDTVDALDLGAFHARHAGGGPRNQPFHPAMMVKVLLYAYATGVFSSRKIARKLHEDVAFRVLGAGDFPKHRSSNNWRTIQPKSSWRWAGRGVTTSRSIRRSARTRRRWPTSLATTGERRPIGDARQSWSRPTAGSSTSWVPAVQFPGLAQGAGRVEAGVRRIEFAAHE